MTDDAKKKFEEYSVMSADNKKNASAITKKSYEDFKSAYESLSGIDIFKDFIPVAEWPENF